MKYHQKHVDDRTLLLIKPGTEAGWSVKLCNKGLDHHHEARHHPWCSSHEHSLQKDWLWSWLVALCGYEVWIEQHCHHMHATITSKETCYSLALCAKCFCSFLLLWFDVLAEVLSISQCLHLSFQSAFWLKFGRPFMGVSHHKPSSSSSSST